ncbi:MAG: SIMPL domain-containing protein [Pyrinomonadaceae bacterium]|nr:SIMPL domain-containing protein [Pyrinomonadaceae bacterium]
MKLKILVLLTVFLFSAFSISAQSIDTSKAPTIQVIGTAEIQIVPDTVTLSFTISKKNKSVAAAKKENDDTIDKVTSLAKRFGIAATDVKTDYIQIKEATKRVKIEGSDNDYEEISDGYLVNRNLVIKLREISKFETFLTSLLDAGVDDVDSVVFTSSELRKYKDQARAQAVRAAREKADAIAKEIGQSIGKAVSIEEKDIDGYRSPYANISSNSFAIDGNEVVENEAVGTISVKAQVEVRFLLN